MRNKDLGAFCPCTCHPEVKVGKRWKTCRVSDVKIKVMLVVVVFCQCQSQLVVVVEVVSVMVVVICHVVG